MAPPTGTFSLLRGQLKFGRSLRKSWRPSAAAGRPPPRMLKKHYGTIMGIVRSRLTRVPHQSRGARARVNVNGKQDSVGDRLKNEK